MSSESAVSFSAPATAPVSENLSELQCQQADRLAELIGRDPEAMLGVLEYWLGPSSDKGCARVDD
jgi:hypothetical protein